MKQISAENVFITNLWVKSQTGKKFEDLPEIKKLDDGRYKAEIHLPTIDVHIACASNSKIETIERLFDKAVKEIADYCIKNKLEMPTTFMKDKIVIIEECGELSWGLNPKYTGKEDSGIKCPICGGTHFIKCDPPIYGSPDARVQSKDCYGCVNCGYVVMFNKWLPNKYHEIAMEIASIDEEINKKEMTLNSELRNICNMEHYKKEISRLKKELKQRKEWGEDNKTTRSLIDSIADLQVVIDGGKNPNAENNAKQLRYEIEQLNLKRDDLYRRTKAINLKAN